MGPDMNTRLILHVFLATVILLLSHVTQAQLNTCGAMDPSAPDWFKEQLDKAEDFHGRGKNRDAYQILYKNQFLPVRVDVSVDPRCVGQYLGTRFYASHREVAS